MRSRSGAWDAAFSAWSFLAKSDGDEDGRRSGIQFQTATANRANTPTAKATRGQRRTSQLQEVFLTVIKNIHTFQGHSQFQTWLFRVAANKARDYRQKLHAAKRGGGQVIVPLVTAPADDSENTFTVDPPSAAPGPDVSLLSAERISLVGQALEELGGPCQEIIELRYFADLSYEEIATSLELNPKTVSSRLSKCLDKLEMVTRARMAREESREKKTPTSV